MRRTNQATEGVPRRRLSRFGSQDKGHGVPAYIVTFSDMVTLLLTFFVMLLSLASVQDPELFGKGRDSLVKSIKGLGLGLLSGRRQRPDFGNVKIRYFISSPDSLLDGRTIHAKEEEIRRIFKNVSRSMKTMPSQIVAQETAFSITNVRFPPGEATLNERTKKFLTEFCLHLQQDSSPGGVRLYVLGLASDAASEKEQWLLSAKRAEKVADFLRGTLSSASGFQRRRSVFGDQPEWSVYSWGAGPGGDWVGRDSPISKQSQILIAVLRAGN